MKDASDKGFPDFTTEDLWQEHDPLQQDTQFSSNVRLNCKPCKLASYRKKSALNGFFINEMETNRMRLYGIDFFVALRYINAFNEQQKTIAASQHGEPWCYESFHCLVHLCAIH